MQNLMNNTTLTMTSQEIADLVESRHDKVKQSIERLAERGIFQLPPLGVVEKINGLGLVQKTEVYRLGKRDSIVVVAQLSPEFTGRLVDRWQELEAKVAQVPKTSAEVLHHVTGLLLEQERRLLEMEAQKQKVAEHTESIKAIEAKQKAIEMSCRDFAIMAYANLIDVKVDLQTAAMLGKRCASLSRERNLPIGKVRDPRFGQVNTYIEDILQEVFTEFAGL